MKTPTYPPPKRSIFRETEDEAVDLPDADEPVELPEPPFGEEVE